jgi:enoyl-CoA hydratase/carnithine racemase
MFAMAFDYRVMRTDRGFICMNEVDMPGISFFNIFSAPLTPGFHAILNAKMPSPIVCRNLILQGRRFPGTECLDLGMVDAGLQLFLQYSRHARQVDGNGL